MSSQEPLVKVDVLDFAVVFWNVISGFSFDLTWAPTATSFQSVEYGCWIQLGVCYCCGAVNGKGPAVTPVSGSHIHVLSMFVLHACVHAACPCTCCMPSCYMPMSMLHANVRAAFPRPCCKSMSIQCPCCRTMSLIHVHGACLCPYCKSMPMLYVHIHAAFQCPCCMSISMSMLYIYLCCMSNLLSPQIFC
jgi:hypothetical protein